MLTKQPIAFLLY